MSPQDPRVNVVMHAQNHMGDTWGNARHGSMGPEDLRPAIDAMSSAYAKHHRLLRSVEDLFGPSLADSLRRSCEPIADALDAADYAAMAVDRKFAQQRDAALDREQSDRELANVLDVAGLQANRDRMDHHARRARNLPETVSVLEAAQFAQDERERLWGEKQDYAERAALAVEQQTAMLGVIEEWAARHGTRREVGQLVRRILEARNKVVIT